MNKYLISILTIVLLTVGLNVYLIGIFESPVNDYNQSVSELEEQGKDFKKIMDDKIVDKEEAKMVTEFEKIVWETDFTEYLHDLDETDNQVTELGLQSYRQNVDLYVNEATKTLDIVLLINYLVNSLPFLILNLLSFGLIFFIARSWLDNKKEKKNQPKEPTRIY